MKTATITDFRQNMKEHLDSIHDDQDILILTGPKKKDFVVMTLANFNSMEETAHLLSTAANAKHLYESIEQVKKGELFSMPSLSEVSEPKANYRRSRKRKSSR